MKALIWLLEPFVWTALVLTGAATAIAFFASGGWPVELFSHFVVQYAAASAACLIYFALRRSWWPALAALILLSVNFAPIWPYYQSAPTMAVRSAPRELRLMVLNLNFANRDVQSVLRTIGNEKPDVLVFHEVDLAWAQALDFLRTDYSFVVSEPADSIFGILLMSRLPVRDYRALRLGPHQRAAIHASICPIDAGRCLTIIAAHPPPPLAADWAAERDAILLEAAGLANKALQVPTVLAGDFNITPWSPVFADMLNQSGLRDSSLGLGVAPTWLSKPLLFGLPIDHVLVSEDVAVTDRYVGPYVGSDHFPVIADLTF